VEKTCPWENSMQNNTGYTERFSKVENFCGQIKHYIWGWLSYIGDIIGADVYHNNCRLSICNCRDTMLQVRDECYGIGEGIHMRHMMLDR